MSTESHCVDECPMKTSGIHWIGLELLTSRSKFRVSFEADLGLVEAHCFLFECGSHTDCEFEEQPDDRASDNHEAADCANTDGLGQEAGATIG